MMNNCWYSLRCEVTDRTNGKDDDTHKGGNIKLVFKHPTLAGTGKGGWMEPSEEVRLSEAKQEAGAPHKQFTREEIEKHSSKDDCWVVINGKVYDATSVLSWHPG